jgi:hypothetical protein
MGKRQKTLSVWEVMLRGIGAALLLYIGGSAALALAAVKGILPEEVSFSVVAALCAMATFLGGSLCSKSMPWGILLNAMSVAAIFAVVLVAIGASCFDGILWSGHGGTLLLCALGGGGLAGVTGGKRRRAKRGRKKSRL